MMDQTIRCALLSSFTLDPLPSRVDKRFVGDTLGLEWYVGGFNQYAQLILDTGSPLYAFGPSIVFLAVAAEDLFAGSLGQWGGSADGAGDSPSSRVTDLVNQIKLLSERLSGARIIVHNLVVLESQPHALLCFKAQTTLHAYVAQANDALYELSAGSQNVFAIDAAGILSSVGLENIVDARYFYLARMRIGHLGLERLADYYARVITAYVGRRKKCIVLDLDNTLWGGVLGEDGANGLQLGQDGIGLAFRTLQARLLAFYQTGTLLAICSKNDEAAALAVLQEHHGMLLRPEHFSAIRINWLDKAANLRAIADELNLGLDSLVFIDDSPVERDQIRYQLPEVTVPEMPADPSEYPDFVAQMQYFDTLVLTNEDLVRGALYATDRARRVARAEYDSLDSYLHTLDIKVTVRAAASDALARAAQLTQKTNQFNLTTRRYTETELHQKRADGSWRIFTAETCDRFGPYGVVGLAIIWIDLPTGQARLDTFLVSCRVLGRGVEAAFLAAVIDDLQRQNIRLLMAEFIATNRNSVARDFLPQQGFVPMVPGWSLSLENTASRRPAWIQLEWLYDEGG